MFHGIWCYCKLWDKPERIQASPVVFFFAFAAAIPKNIVPNAKDATISG